MAKIKTRANPNIYLLWPTTVLVKRFAHYQKINPELYTLFNQHRDKEQGNPKPAYASADDLLNQYPMHQALGELAQFIGESVYEVAREANAGLWQENETVKVNLTGLWFQISNGHAFHETHVHGNCSWSGVYYVQSGASSSSPDSHIGNQANGLTRFYGPYMEHMAGGHGDYGNYYLQESSWDSYPQDGKICVFPSHLKHMIYPYNGVQDRIVVSFHAQLYNAKGVMNYGYGMSNK